jgi:hypothetical protein
VEGWVAQNWLKAAPPAPADITVFRSTTTFVSGQTTLDFGSVERRQGGPVRIVTVRNDGFQTLTLGTITVPSGFALLDGLPTTIPRLVDEQSGRPRVPRCPAADAQDPGVGDAVRRQDV